MTKKLLAAAAAFLAMTGAVLLGNQMVSAQGQAFQFAAVPGQRGGQDIMGPYDVDPDWPQDISTLPGNEDWTWGAGQSVFAFQSHEVVFDHEG